MQVLLLGYGQNRFSEKQDIFTKRMPVLLFLCYNINDCKNRMSDIVQGRKACMEGFQKDMGVLYDMGRLVCKRYLW